MLRGMLELVERNSFDVTREKNVEEGDLQHYGRIFYMAQWEVSVVIFIN